MLIVQPMRSLLLDIVVCHVMVGSSFTGGVRIYLLDRTQFAMTTTIESFKESCRYVLDIICKESCYKATGYRKMSL